MTVVPLRAPLGVAARDSWSTAYASHQFLLPLISPGWQLGDLSGETVVLNANGRPEPVLLQTVGTGSVPTTGVCRTAADLEDGVELSTTPVPGPGPLFAKVTYQLDTAGELRVIAFDGLDYRFGVWPQPVTAGLHTTIVPLPSGDVDGVRLYGTPVGSTLCVTSLELVRPLLVTGNGSCAVIDEFARPIEPVDPPACPTN